MGLPDIKNIPESGAVFTIGRSRFAENVASHFFIRKDPVVSVTCGDEHSAVICQSGRLFVFGSNDWGQLGLGHKNHVSKPSCVKVLKPERVTHVACGRAHTLVCTAGQKIFACGSDQESQLGRGSLAVGDSSSSPIMIHDCGLAGPKLLQIAAGSHHSLALTSDGEVLAWGSNLEGQLGLPGTSGLVNKPTKVHLPEPAKQISAGYYHSAFLTESGKVYVCGESESGKLGIAVDFRTQVAPKQMLLSGPAAEVACGGHHTLVLGEDGKMYCTGSNASGQLGMGSEVTEIPTPKLLPCDALQGETIEKIGCGESHIAIVTDSGKLYTCGDFRHGKLGLEETEKNVHELTPAVKYQELVVTDVSCGGCHTILVGQRRATDDDEVDKRQQDQAIQQKKNPLPPLKMPGPRVPNENSADDKTGDVPPDVDNNRNESSAETTENVPEKAVNGTDDSINGIEKPVSPKEYADYEEVPTKTPSNLDRANEENGEEYENNNGEAAETIVDAENNVTGEVGNEPETAKRSRTSGSGVSRIGAEEREKSANGSREEDEVVEKPDSPPLPVEPPPKPPRQKIGSAENSVSSRRGSSSSRLGSAVSGEKENDDGRVENLPSKRPESRSNEEDEEEKKEEKKETGTKPSEEPSAEPELPVDGEETAEDEEEKATSDGGSTKKSAGSEKSRSAKSKAGTDETVEADGQNGLDDIEDVPVETKADIVADVAHSAAPRTAGKMAKLFKSKKQEAENGIKASSTTSTKAKSKTCIIL